MALTKIRLGELVELLDNRNTEKIYNSDDVRGISTGKSFIETKANMNGVSVTSYKIVSENEFAYVADTSRRGDKIAVAFNNNNAKILISSIYTVFRVKRKDLLLSDYLFMYFNRPEFDRYSRFNSWGSARETFSWDDFCDIELDLPPIEIQQKYVDVYNAMVANQQSYERGLEDLKLVCDAYIEDLRRNMPCEAIGCYLTQTVLKNESGEKIQNKSVSNTKTFINAKSAIINGVDTKNYLIVESKSFAYNTVTTRNADKLSIALNREEKCLVSPIYTTFKVSNSNLIPEYLCLWFNRSEYDRFSRYNSWGSARELFSFSVLSETKIPIPEIAVQKSIANIYKIYNERKLINEKLKAQIKDICPVLIKGSIEEAKKEA